MRLTRVLSTIPDYFKVLSVESDASNEEIKKAYLREAKRWHPDANKAEGAQARFQLVGEAFNNLKTASQRDSYRFEISPEAQEDWTQRGRKESKYEQARAAHGAHNVEYEFNEAERRWTYKNADSGKMRFSRLFERAVHPRVLFGLLPLGLLAYWAVTIFARAGVEQIIAAPAVVDMDGRPVDGTGAAVAGAGASSSSLEAKKTNHVQAWRNPSSGQWEPPAPWDPRFAAGSVKLVSRQLVRPSTSKPPGSR